MMNSRNCSHCVDAQSYSVIGYQETSGTCEWQSSERVMCRQRSRKLAGLVRISTVVPDGAAADWSFRLQLERATENSNKQY